MARSLPPTVWNDLRVLVPLLILSLISLDCVAVAAYPQLQTHRQREFVLMTVTFSQTSLLGVWLVFGRGTDVARVALLLASVFLVHAVLEALGTNVGPIVYVLEILAALSAICLLSLRFRGFRLTIPDVLQDLPRGLPQYSMGRLMGWMTSAALICLFFRVLPLQPERTLWFLTVLLPFAVTTALACRAAFSAKPLAGRLVASSVAALALGGIPGALYADHRDSVFDIAGACFAHGVLLTGYLMVFRVAGYRLIRSERAPPAAASVAA